MKITFLGDTLGNCIPIVIFLSISNVVSIWLFLHFFHVILCLIQLFLRWSSFWNIAFNLSFFMIEIGFYRIILLFVSLILQSMPNEWPRVKLHQSTFQCSNFLSWPLPRGLRVHVVKRSKHIVLFEPLVGNINTFCWVKHEKNNFGKILPNDGKYSVSRE